MALTADKKVIKATGEWLVHPEPPLYAAASTLIYGGGVVAVSTVGASAGYVVNGTALASLTVLGVARFRADNSAGAAGDIKVSVDRAPHWLDNSAGDDELANEHVGKYCFLVDNETVSLTSGGGARPVCGRVMGVDATYGVLVEFHDIDAGSLPAAVYNVAHGDFTDADTAETVALGDLEPGSYIVEKQLNTPFSGGGNTAADVTIGVSGNLDSAAASFDVFTGAATARVPVASDSGMGFTLSVTTAMVLTLTSATGTVAGLTAGDLDIIVRRVRL